MARGRNALGLDIGTSSIKLVQLKESKKGIQLASFSMAPLPSEAIVDGAVMNSGAVVDTIQAMVAAQKRPWQRPMPARVAFFRAATATRPLAISVRRRPAVTSSQRQMMVSSVMGGGGLAGR